MKGAHSYSSVCWVCHLSGPTRLYQGWLTQHNWPLPEYICAHFKLWEWHFQKIPLQPKAEARIVLKRGQTSLQLSTSSTRSKELLRYSCTLLKDRNVCKHDLGHHVTRFISSSLLSYEQNGSNFLLLVLDVPCNTVLCSSTCGDFACNY